MIPPLYIGVIGTGEEDPALCAAAEEVGARIAKAGAVLVSGGLGGVMRASCKGAAGQGGMTLGFLPGGARSEANEFVQVAVPTGMGEQRNHLVVRTSDGLIAVGGGYGTLSELALALKLGKPLVGLMTWEFSINGKPVGIPAAPGPREAVEALMALAARRPSQD